MTAATATMWNNQQSRNVNRMLARHQDFQFMFAIATAHELTHLFVGYLAQGDDGFLSYTPPQISYLNYGGVGDNNLEFGEAGRWFERRLFGGSIEFYRDVQDDHGQVSSDLAEAGIS